MKITIDLENEVTIGKNLMDYVKGTINNIATLIEIDCNIEIVNYKTREDTQLDINLFEVVDAIHEQIISNLDTGTAQNPPTPYKC